jgi:transposase
MQLTHKIALCPTPEQVDYFKCACGTARRVWNWALNEWNKRYAVGFGVFRSQLEYKARSADPETAGNRNCPTRGESDQ